MATDQQLEPVRSEAAPIPVLSLWEPWASAIACGLKQLETRSWRPPRRLRGQRLAIHAAKRTFGFSSDTAELVRSLPLDEYRTLKAAIHGDPEVAANYPLGHIVATATLVGIWHTEDVHAMGWQKPGRTNEDWGDGWDALYVSENERRWGDYSPGRFAWQLGDVTPLLRPVPFAGGQGLTKTWRP